ncbi:hypothetical protein K388_06943 [Streptomyces sp. KhCrAH-43]|uniref:hypothetical protein n=1 Tax=unclassified Streptomyces TaxID=2593676 RepID=UPI00037CAC77|nr:MULTISPECIES: hypothetical protein [unclassified Streptomyces]MYS32934.1 hypothetical protein [Streptomyces sp. SID4920]MYX64275.1 hypothetical protein [Streptomyces sp. SID8373]RAJ48677.1 hypothetical protein K388_06943 [Streptomyces sp. KhCrAH-43]
MIPNGVTPADDQTAADIFGVSVGYWQSTKHWEKIRGLKLLNREGSRRRIYSKEQLLAARAEEERAKAVNEMPQYDLPPVPTGAHPDDLLDLEESLYALPEEKRVTLSTWKTYRYGTKTSLPAPDFNLGGKKPDVEDGGGEEADGEVVGGEDFWRRQTILDWAANRRGRGNPKGRPVGRKESQSRPPNPQAEARRERARLLLDEIPTVLTAKMLGEHLGVHPVHAERILRAARLDKVREMLAGNPNLLVADVQEALGLNVHAHAKKLLHEARKAGADTQ